MGIGLIKMVQMRMRRMGMKARKRVRIGLIKTGMKTRMRRVGVMRRMSEDRVNKVRMRRRMARKKRRRRRVGIGLIKMVKVRMRRMGMKMRTAIKKGGQR